MSFYLVCCFKYCFIKVFIFDLVTDRFDKYCAYAIINFNITLRKLKVILNRILRLNKRNFIKYW